MRKISINREQSQAGLSFAKRENRRSLAGGESNFRPQVKNKLLLLLALLLTAVTGAWAQDQSWDSGDCTVTFSEGVMTVSGTGAMEDYLDYNFIPWDVYRYDTETIVIESGVTSIGNNAFARFTYLKSVSIPASVTSIGEAAFEECGYEATTAVTVSFAEGSTPLTIGDGAFQYANLKSIDIPNRVTSIGEGAFTNCRNLESVSIPASVTSIGQNAFQNCGSNAEALTVSFAEGSTPLTIGESAFYESNLTSIDIPNRVTSIGNNAFTNCNNLESVSIPASVTSIGVAAFGWCGKLAKVSIYAPSLTTYGANAFQSNASGRKIYVLPTAVDTYKAGWPDYADDIEAMTLTLYATSVKEGTEDADHWTISPNPAAEGQTVTIEYTGQKEVKRITAVKKAPAVTGNIVDLSTLTADYEAQNGDVLTGVTSSYKVTIAAGATVTLDGVTISRGSYCIKCLGDATIILKDGSTNTLTGTGDEYPALSIGDANTTLTIQGSTGVLNVTSGDYCAGIGGGYMNADKTCGNIRIEGGVITAQGGYDGAGIGTDAGEATCGDIIITGGTITAKGVSKAAGIGTGIGSSEPAVCGNITIANTVTKVTATKGDNAAQSIGKGYGSIATCGTVTIGGTKYWENNAAVNGGDTYLATSPLIYDPSAPAAAEGHALSASAVGEIVGSDGKAYAVADKDNLPEGVTAVAIVAYKGSETGEASPYTHGLAIAMKDAAAGGTVKWSSSENDESLDNYTDYSPAVTTAQSGLSNSQTSGFDNESNYPAFYAALHNTITVSDGISAAAPASGTSGWFLPSLYQWNKIVQGLSGKTVDLSHGGNANANYTASSLNPKIEAAGGTGLQSGYYWPSTEKNNTSAWYFTTSNGSVGYRNKTGEGYVRSAFAF